jgi:hypothetical protein
VTRDAIANSAGTHAVQFYEQDSELTEIVGRWLRDTDPADVSIVVATEAHRAQFAAALGEACEATSQDRIVWLDATATLDRLIVAGEIDLEAFDAEIGVLVRSTTQGGGVVRVYGEMVALLWEAGNVLAALKLEGLWNDLAAETPFALLCSYPGSVHGDPARADALMQVCEAHSACHHTWSEDGTAVAHASASEGVRAAFPSRPAAPGYARRVTAQALQQWGYSDEARQDAELVVSELVTNAVLHADSELTLSVHRDDGDSLLIAVQDTTPLPASAIRPFVAHPGHGLGIVATISAAWGVDPARGGKIVWAQIQA